MMGAVDGIAESMSVTELDAKTGTFRATYDSFRDPPSLAVVAVVAIALGSEPENLPPLQSVVDADALDKLAMGSATRSGTWDSISFRYHGFAITVTGEDVIEGNSLEST